jgi:hypothetical protein
MAAWEEGVFQFALHIFRITLFPSFPPQNSDNSSAIVLRVRGGPLGYFSFAAAQTVYLRHRWDQSAFFTVTAKWLFSWSLSHIVRRRSTSRWKEDIKVNLKEPIYFFSLLALQPPLGVVFYSPLAGFSLLAYEVPGSHTTTRHSR